MQQIIHSLFSFFFHLGAAGVLLLGVLDSSFLMLPLGNDLLVTALTISHRERAPLYVALASLGSMAGVLLIDLIARKGGEAGLQKAMSARRFEYLKRKMSENATIPLALVCVAPPPFPFTPVIAAASAFNYPRSRLLLIVFFGRAVRFAAVTALAISFGRQILEFTKSGSFVAIMGAVILLSLVGSVLSVWRWIRQSRRAR